MNDVGVEGLDSPVFMNYIAWSGRNLLYTMNHCDGFRGGNK